MRIFILFVLFFFTPLAWSEYDIRNGNIGAKDNERQPVTVKKETKEDISKSELSNVFDVFEKRGQQSSLKASEPVYLAQRVKERAKERAKSCCDSGECRGGNLSVRVDVSGGAGESFEGVVDKEAIRRVIKRNVKQLRTCYERLVQRDPNNCGRVDLSWTITANGHVGTVRIVKSQIKDKRTLDCMKLRLSAWRFPDPPEGVVGDITYPFVFILSELYENDTNLMSLRVRINVSGGAGESFEGIVDKEAIRRVIGRNARQLKKCYERFAQRYPGASELRVDLNWTIGANGRVGSVKIVKSQIMDKNTLDCIKLRLAAWRFPAPPEGVVGDITYPFGFIIETVAPIRKSTDPWWKGLWE